MRTDGEDLEREIALRMAEADLEQARRDCENATEMVRRAQAGRARAIGRYAEASRRRRELARGDQ